LAGGKKKPPVGFLPRGGKRVWVGGGGGEAYGKLELFQQRTAEIMQRLVGQLDNWIRAAGGAG